VESLWPIIILWVLAALFSGRKKKAQAPGASESAGAEPGRAHELSSELSQALAQLKGAEEVAVRRQAGGAPHEAVRRESGGAQEEARQREGKERAKAYLEQQRRKAAGRPSKQVQRGQVFLPGQRAKPDRVVRRPVRALDDDDADKTSEAEPVVETLEGGDYDEEAERLIAERRQTAERDGLSREEISEAQLARRGARPAVAIGGQAEHAAWHEQAEIGKPVAAASKRASPLARYADGSLRSAVVLSEILGKPLAERA